MIERFPIHRALALALRDVNLLKRLTTLNSYKTLQRRMQIIFWHFSFHIDTAVFSSYIDTAVEMGPPLPFPRNKDRPNDYGKPSSPQPMPPYIDDIILCAHYYSSSNNGNQRREEKGHSLSTFRALEIFFCQW